MKIKSFFLGLFLGTVFCTLGINGYDAKQNNDRDAIAQDLETNSQPRQQNYPASDLLAESFWMLPTLIFILIANLSARQFQKQFWQYQQDNTEALKDNTQLLKELQMLQQQEKETLQLYLSLKHAVLTTKPEKVNPNKIQFTATEFAREPIESDELKLKDLRTFNQKVREAGQENTQTFHEFNQAIGEMLTTKQQYKQYLKKVL